jgi:hypothetical protein
MADKVDYFDDTFVGNHCEWAEAIIAINSLHFIPLNQFIKRLDQLNFVLKKQGRAYVTFNVQRVIEFTSVNEFLEIGLIKEEILDRNNNSLIMLENHFRKLLENSNFKFLCVDIDFKKYAVEASVDGNIRLVMEK